MSLVYNGLRCGSEKVHALGVDVRVVRALGAAGEGEIISRLTVDASDILPIEQLGRRTLSLPGRVAQFLGR